MNGIFFNQGHVCCAGSRLLVQEPLFETFLEKLKARLGTLRVGDPLDKNTDVGAINSRAQLTRIEELVASGVEEGAQMYQPDCALPERGFWFRPTLFTGVSQSHRIAREEIFGPVLSILTFRTPEEAVEKANNTPYGLSAGVWTEKGSRILWMAERCAPAWCGRTRSTASTPRRPSAATRRAGSGARAVCMAWSRTSRSTETRDERRARARAPHRQAVHRRSVPAIGVRTLLSGARARRAIARARGAGLAQGPSRRGGGRARGPAGVVGLHGLQPRAGPVSSGGADGGTARPVPRGAHRRGRGRSRPGRRRLHRPVGVVRGLGRQDRADPGRSTRSPAPTSTSRSRSRRGWSGSSRRRTSRCWV